MLEEIRAAAMIFCLGHSHEFRRAKLAVGDYLPHRESRIFVSQLREAQQAFRY
jgi:hypothetical protein